MQDGGQCGHRILAVCSGCRFIRTDLFREPAQQLRELFLRDGCIVCLNLRGHFRRDGQPFAGFTAETADQPVPQHQLRNVFCNHIR